MTAVRSFVNVDLSDDASFKHGFPRDYFAWLRENEPVYWQPRRRKTNE